MLIENNQNDKMTLTLAQIAKVLDADLSGKDCAFSHLSINTRSVSEGDLFVAIKGENFDAHEYLHQAEEKGCCAVVIEKNVATTVAQLQVNDTRIALGQIASLWRDAFTLPLVAITGSCGKTTVKEMTSAIFKQTKEPVLSTAGNLNNDIGVPLTLMRLNKTHTMAVIEIGANHSGEINQLVNFVKPDAAVITNVGHAHIEGFGSIEGVAKAKAEIYNGLSRNGTAVINADDAFADYWHSLVSEKKQTKAISILTFGLDNAADISADYSAVENGLELRLKTPSGKINIHLNHYGKHNIYNALAATALALSSGCTLEQIKAGLESFKNISGRLEQKPGIAGAVIFDDTYNANPGSVKAGIDAIQQLQGRAVLILGDMGELGVQAEKLHYQLGVDAANMGLKQLFTVGITSNETCKGFNSVKNRKGDNALHFATKDELLSQVKKYLQQASLDKQDALRKIVLVKGSRTMAMETVVAALVADKATSDNINMTMEGAH